MANFLIGLFANLRFCSPRSTFVQLRFAKPSTSSKKPNQKGLGWLKSEFEVLQNRPASKSLKCRPQVPTLRTPN